MLSTEEKSSLWQKRDINVISSLFSLQISELAEDVAVMHWAGFMALLPLHTVLPQISASSPDFVSETTQKPRELRLEPAASGVLGFMAGARTG